MAPEVRLGVYVLSIIITYQVRPAANMILLTLGHERWARAPDAVSRSVRIDTSLSVIIL
jgi:hypothetical protein